MTRWGSVSCGNKHTEGVQMASPDRYFGVAHSGGLVPQPSLCTVVLLPWRFPRAAAWGLASARSVTPLW